MGADPPRCFPLLLAQAKGADILWEPLVKVLEAPTAGEKLLELKGKGLAPSWALPWALGSYTHPSWMACG